VRGVILYLTAGVFYVLGSWTWVLSKHPQVYERTRDEYGAMSAAQRRRFWVNNLFGPITFWPASLALMLFVLFAPGSAAGRIREKYATQFRRDFLDSDRMRRSLEPEMPESAVVVDFESEPSPPGATCVQPLDTTRLESLEGGPDYEPCGMPGVMRYRTIYSGGASPRVVDFCALHDSHGRLGEAIGAEFESP
jgi:hypothetical protein